MDEWITTTEAAKLSGYNVEYIRRLLRTNKLRSRKFGPVWQVSRAALSEYTKEVEKSSDGRHGPKVNSPGA